MPGTNLNLLNVVDPGIDAINNNKFNDANVLNGDDVIENNEDGETKRLSSLSRIEMELDHHMDTGYGKLGPEEVEANAQIVEAQIIVVKNKEVGAAWKAEGEKNLAPLGSNSRPQVCDGSGSSSNCPYPAGFEPSNGYTHVHREIRAQCSPNVVRETPETVEEQVSVSPSVNDAKLVVRDGVPSQEEGQCSVETLYLINEGGFRLCEEVVKGDEAIEGVDLSVCGAEDRTGKIQESEEEERSDETLYRINRDVFNGHHTCAIVTENDDEVQSQHVVSSATGNAVHKIEFHGCGTENDLIEEDTDFDEEWEEECRIEATETKSVWGKGGLFFDSND
ncbi:hypothetical protein PIB30_080387 [Stylosanthes scabra]|uniref:Uncharacterized protein n=1 Tax=Stylosanthes scabra TaxID=79078 RepID=A0ABU6RSK4_9FABA|nr:hypothetical protein [Stylosanthes scabra]